MKNHLKYLIGAAERLATNVQVLVAFVGLVLISLGVLLIAKTSFGDGLGIVFALIGIAMLLALLLVTLSGEYARFSVLPNIAAVSTALRQAVSNMSAGAIHQTFVGANLIAGRHDFIRSLPKGPEGQIEVNRYFFISSAFDVNFVAHSIAFEETARQKGVRLRNYVWAAPEAGILAENFWNITNFPDRVILTISSRDDQRHGHADIVKDSDSKDVIGLAIRSKKVGHFVTNHYCERLARAHTVSLVDAANRTYRRDRDLFFSAAVHSVVKEWCADEQFALEKGAGRRIACAALVGSFARQLNRRKEAKWGQEPGTGDLPQWPHTGQEIDLLVFVRELKQADINALRAIGREVLTRFEMGVTCRARQRNAL